MTAALRRYAAAVRGAEFTRRSGEVSQFFGLVVESNGPELRLVSPLPGTTYLLDPDLPSSGRVPLAAQGVGQLTWQSDSVECRVINGRPMALIREGEHRINVRDTATGRRAETWIRVKAL